MQLNQRTWLIAALVGLFVCAGHFEASAQSADANPKAPQLDAQNSQIVIREIEPELQRLVDRQRRLPGQAKLVSVKVNPDIETGDIWIDLDEGYLPKGQKEMEEVFGEKVREIQNAGYDLLENIVRFRYLRVRIGGKSLGEIFQPVNLKRQKEGATGAFADAAPVEGLVVLNPGHGKYLHHGTNA